MSNNTASVDWLSFSLPRAYTEETIPAVVGSLFSLDFDKFQHIYQKQNFYRQRHTYKTDSGKTLLHVFLEPDTKHNVNTTAFIVPGYAFSNSPDALSYLDPIELCKKIMDRGGQLTRLDLALDDFSGAPILEQMIENSKPDIWKDRIVSPLRFTQPVAVWDQTIYFGHRSKGNSIAAYNKAAEQKFPGPWFRCEFRARERILLDSILLDIYMGKPTAELATELIARYLMFKPPGKKGKYKRPDAEWWLEFLGSARTYQFSRHKAGTLDDEPKKPPKAKAFEKYMREALARDKTGALLRIAVEVVEEELVDKEWEAGTAILEMA